ncbi:vitamin B12 ABC transporter permease BtuC [Vibrio ostreicida]|uniref:Vitamin B12 import system permease protein BtuC n=1 Tax=Vibrio ostreicida TaxID=526588 RepID=A0ABT8BUU1_9VIBR|nr:vitamin B12 ABC transporter permease BtuC [Vibrio ostreicida]MDN3610154.1 vitamin B12 ABC transporter permease BtuC [Vibrio ostreicida]NPD07823.1 vitamin B12 ABC transporter permease BtuC [Vibrio ostreicida]
MELRQLLIRRHHSWKRCLIILVVMLLVCASAHLIVGEVFISPLSEMSALQQQLIVQLRLPRLLAAVVIGASLAVSGAVLQVLLGNVLAEPGVLGISGGASVMMVGLLFLFPVFATPVGFMIAAVAGALIFTLLLVSMVKVMKLSTTRLLLVGVALGILTSAMVTWAFYFSDELSLRQLMYWLMGTIGGASWYHHVVTLVMVPVIVWLCLKGKTLDKLMMGEQHAKQLGVDIDSVRWKLILAVSILVGGTVALGGVIGFIGLIVPHLLRLMLGSENQYLVPVSAISGALLLVVADIIARLALDSAELPLGVVTTTLGAPVFIWMLIKHHDTR